MRPLLLLVVFAVDVAVAHNWPTGLGSSFSPYEWRIDSQGSLTSGCRDLRLSGLCVGELMVI